ncbi:hypothetical protein [Litchfieldella rifensis]|uniref:Uncharacterized protein n=1 Tax=Litchfieldella rifensis TaxID=762643 RepID=A0ABV7LK66_9GAMM
MKTIRWLRVKWPLPLLEVSKKLIANQYNEDVGRGFILASSGKNRIAGKFVERITEKAFIIDPFGNETESYSTTYYVAKFSFDSSSCFLELESPPRSIRKLASELHSMVGLGLELSDIKVDPLKWLQEIEASHTPLLVKNISSSAITVPKNGLAKISVSGKKDIRDEFSKVVGKRKRVIDLVKFSGDFNQCSISAEITKTGFIKYSGHIYDGFIGDIRKCLERSVLEGN